jgi:hypothetical protein
MTNRLIGAFLIVVNSAVPMYAQNSESSSWGVVGTMVPNWEVTSTFEPIAALYFSEDDIAIKDQNLKGAEFRIGFARGRATGGDWGVSFVRRTFEDVDARTTSGAGCSGGGTTVVVLRCEDFEADLVRRDTVLNGIEAHKFVPFFTIARRVQVGMNIAGGLGFMSGEVNITNFRTTYTCTFPPGVFPGTPTFDDDGPGNQCAGATVSNRATVQTGSSSGDIQRLLKSESSMIPIGRAEIGGAVIVTPHFKVRIAGGLNYPGTNVVAITGVVFFGND